MISQSTIDQILETARIEEVVGEYVSLKKRGSNYIGKCPFHGENTPSFNVNPARNIFKCFGCQVGGNVVSFLMKHDNISYPEALRNLAERYKIPIEETTPSPQEQQQLDEKESLYILNAFALKSFSEQLQQSEEGKAIGLSYLKERGITEESIRKFELGYSFEEINALAKLAVKNGYEEKYLEKTGLCFRTERGTLMDRFRGRVMFPIHNVSGRVIGFGGRTLKKDEKIPKYVNSTESDIYNKSLSLYGVFQAKKSIQKNDCCHLAEGYLDVIGMSQAGVENVVASCGTSLTEQQLKLLGRYTKNIVLLYDGDKAGIDASVKAVDLVLKAGLNIKVVVFPEGNDPDSFARNNEASKVVAFIQQEAIDGVIWKTKYLLKTYGNDPIRKTDAIKIILNTLALIPDAILRSNYVRQCSTLVDINESILNNELNKLLRQQVAKSQPKDTGITTELLTETIAPPQEAVETGTEEQEKNIIRLLLNYGHRQITFSDQQTDENGERQLVSRNYYVSRFIVEEIALDNISFDHPVYNSILVMYAQLPEEQPFLDVRELIHSDNNAVRNATVELLSTRYELSENWQNMHGIHVPLEEHELLKTVEQSVFHLKKKKVMKMLEQNRERIKAVQSTGEGLEELLIEHQRLEKVKAEISRFLGIDIIK